MSLLAWLMLVIGTLQAAPVSAPAPMHPGMAMQADACPPAATHVDVSLHADCCHGDGTSPHCACPVALASALVPPIDAPSLSGRLAAAPIDDGARADPPDRAGGPPFRPPQV